MSPTESPWAQNASTLLDVFQADAQKGLTNKEADARLQEHGPNQLRPAPRRSLLSILWAQLKSLIVLLLAVAAGLALAFGDITEAIAVGMVLVINTGIGFFTELRAVRSVEALQRMGSVQTRTLRDGQLALLPAEALVPGDVVLLEAGDIITADLRILEASRLEANESTLTGESVPVPKAVPPVPAEAPIAERASLLYKGTTLTRGSARGLVILTGMGTELGRIAEWVEGAESNETPLEVRLDELGRRLIWVSLAIAVAITLSGYLAGRPLLEIVETALALAVASIPEGLPIIATIALARGVHRMAQANALVSRLSAVETLGATSVLCTDKTGTLTENRMSVAELYTPLGDVLAADLPAALDAQTPMLEAMALCNNATHREEEESGDPLEIALLVAAKAAGLDLHALAEDAPRQAEDAFDADTRRMATRHPHENGARWVVKGAPESVLAHCATLDAPDGSTRIMDETTRSAWLARNEEAASGGLRILAVAEKCDPTPTDTPYQALHFLGLVGLADPARPGVDEVIKTLHGAGIQVVMVTGDQIQTAKGIAKAVGLPPGTPKLGTTLAPLEDLNPGARLDLAESTVFARVNPEEKLHLIALHQAAGHVVAMTGDGVNDAPALKKADIGIAMGERGTEVAKEAADMVLLDDQLATLVHAVKEGRAIFDNLRRFVVYLLSCNLSEVLVVGLATISGAPLPLLPLQILFLNLVTDVFPALALGVGEAAPGILARPPRSPDEPFLTRTHWKQIIGYGAVITLSTLGAFAIALGPLQMDTAGAVTISFLTLALAQLWNVFNMRDRSSPRLRNEITENRWVWWAILLCVGLLLAATLIPPVAAVLALKAPTFTGWMLALGASLIPMLVGLIPGKAREE